MERWLPLSFSSRPSSACPGTLRGKMAKVRQSQRYSFGAYVTGGGTSEFTACLGGYFSVRVPGPGWLPGYWWLDNGTHGSSRDSRLLLRFLLGWRVVYSAFTSFPPHPPTTICGHLHSKLVQRQRKHGGAAFFLSLYSVLIASHVWSHPALAQKTPPPPSP